MPLPFAMPPRLQVTLPILNDTATSFSCVSVVMMPSEASELPSFERLFTRSGIPAAIGAMSSGCPMTPVDATTISFGEMPRACAARSLIFSAISIPSALQVLAFPLLQITACAVPSARCFFVTVSGAPFTRFVVYTAAADAGTSDRIMARSFFTLFFLIPQCTPPAVNPFAAHTPPLTSSIISSFILRSQGRSPHPVPGPDSCSGSRRPKRPFPDYQNVT